MTPRGKRIAGITLALILIASVLMLIAPTTADVNAVGWVPLSKEATRIPKQYYVGEDITYNLTIFNPNHLSGCTVDLYDQFGTEAEVLVQSGINLAASDNVSGGADTWTGQVTFSIEADDVVTNPLGQWVINNIRVEGNETVPPYNPLAAWIGETVQITPTGKAEAPAFTPIGLIALVSALSSIAAVAIVRKRR